MVPSRSSSGDEPIAELLDRLRPDVEHLLATYEVPEAEAAELLQEVLVVLSYRWQRVADREAWLLATLRRRCQRWRAEQDDAVQPS